MEIWRLVGFRLRTHMTFAELRQTNVIREGFPYCESWDVFMWSVSLEAEARKVKTFLAEHPGQEAVGHFQEIVPTLARVVIIADCIAARFGADMDKAITGEV